MTPDDELRAIAEAATPVAWRTHDNYNYVVDANRRTICLLHGSVGSFANAVNNARFVATFDPPTVKGLLDRIAGLEAELAEYRSVESARDAGWSVIQLRDGSKK